MTGFQLKTNFFPCGDQPKAIKLLTDGIKNDINQQVLLGITGSGKTFTMANIIKNVQKPTLILSHNKTLAAQLFGEFKQLFPNNAVEYFISYYDYYQPEAYLPVSDTYIEKDSSINEEIDKFRIRATSSLMSRQDVIVIASVSCIYGVGSPKEYEELIITLSKNQKVNLKEFFKSLVNIHYVRNDTVMSPGTFRVRGDTIDVFPVYDEHPIRIELFGDEIDNLSKFDYLTGEIINHSVDAAEIMAIIATVEIFMFLTMDSGQKIVIYTDSLIAKKILCDKRRPPNTRIFSELRKRFNKLIEVNGIDIVIKKVKAHAGIEQNELADMIAKKRNGLI